MPKNRRRSNSSPEGVRPHAPMVVPLNDDMDLVGNAGMLLRTEHARREQRDDELDELRALKLVEKARGDDDMRAMAEKRAQEQTALEKWNVNAEGRNQGLVHLVDYTAARPMAHLGDLAPDDQEILRRTDTAPSSGADLVDRLSGGRKQFEQLKKGGKLVPDVDGEGRPLGLSDEASDELSAAVRRIDALDEPIGTLGRRIGNVSREIAQAEKEWKGIQDEEQKREAGAALAERRRHCDELKAERARLTKERQVLAERVDDLSRWRIGREESKSGRMKAMGIPKGREVLDGTQRVLDLLAEPEIQVRAPDREIDGMRRVQDDDRVRWEPARLGIDQLSDTATAQVEGDGMRVHMWGVLPRDHVEDPKWDDVKDSMRISTVIPMGSSNGKSASKSRK